MANDRISQLPVEALILPTSGKARISQEAVEVLIFPTSGKARMSQLAIEVLIGPVPLITDTRVPLSRVVSGGARW